MTTTSDLRLPRTEAGRRLLEGMCDDADCLDHEINGMSKRDWYADRIRVIEDEAATPASDNEGLANAIRRVEGLTIQFVDEAGQPYEPADKRDDEDWADHLARRIGVATPEPPRETEGLAEAALYALQAAHRPHKPDCAQDRFPGSYAEPADPCTCGLDALLAALAAARSVTPLEGLDAASHRAQLALLNLPRQMQHADPFFPETYDYETVGLDAAIAAVRAALASPASPESRHG